MTKKQKCHVNSYQKYKIIDKAYFQAEKKNKMAIFSSFVYNFCEKIQVYRQNENYGRNCHATGINGYLINFIKPAAQKVRVWKSY